MGAPSAPQRSSLGTPRWSPGSLLGRADLPWLALALLVAVGLRVAWVVYVNVDPNDGRFDDSVFYHNTAHMLAQGVGYMDPWGRGPTGQWPPGYPAALAVLYKLFGWHLVPAKVLNIVFAAATVVLVYLLARRLFDRRVAVLGATALAAFPGQIYFSTLVYTETMFAMLFVLVLLLALLWTVERPDSRWWQVLSIGFLVGVAAMVRSEGIFLAVVLAAIWAVTVRPWRSVVGYGALTALAVVVTVTPWTVRNAIELHAFVPLRTGAGDIIARSLDPEATDRGDSRTIGEGVRYQLTHAWEMPGFILGRMHVLYEHDSDAIRLMQTRPRGADFQQPLTQEEETRWRRVADRYFFVVGAAALAGAALCLLRRNRASLVIVVGGVGWSLLFGYVQPYARYHFPVGPLMAILAAAFAVLAWDRAVVVWRSLLSRAKAERAAPAGADPPADGAS